MLRQRLLSGFMIVATLLFAGFYFPPAGIWLVFLLAVAFGQLEFYHITNVGGIPAFRVVGVLSGTALLSVTYWTVGPRPEQRALANELQMLVLALTILAVFIRQFPQKHNNKPLATIGCTLLGIWYVPFLFNYFNYVAFGWDDVRGQPGIGLTGFMMAAFLVAVVKLTDVGAYFTGRAFGRHKLFPRISPAKTWEGFFGGIATAMVCSLLFQYFSGGHFGVLTMSRMHAAILGVLLALAGVAGDLFESLLKRAAGVKDSSGVVPGMGGVLDVIDSLLFGAPVLYYYARFFLPVG